MWWLKFQHTTAKSYFLVTSFHNASVKLSRIVNKIVIKWDSLSSKHEIIIRKLEEANIGSIVVPSSKLLLKMLFAN